MRISGSWGPYVQFIRPRDAGPLLTSTAGLGIIFLSFFDLITFSSYNSFLPTCYSRFVADTWLPNMKFTCRFNFSRFPIRLQHRAVQLAVEHSLEMLFLFPIDTTVCMRRLIQPLDSNIKSVFKVPGIREVILVLVYMWDLILKPHYNFEDHSRISVTEAV